MRIVRLLAATLVAAFLAVLVPGPAWAHNSLTKAEPGRNATLDRAPAGVRLTFLQKVDPEALTITVTDAAQRAVSTGPAGADGRTGSIDFTEPPGNGVYTVTYRVVSLDGHPVQGSYRFTVDDPTATPAPSAAPVSPSAQPSSAPAAAEVVPVSPSAQPSEPAAADVVPVADASDDSSRWPLAAGAAAVAVLAVAAVLVLRRRRTP
jgi:methionine-rich copper-binding protein CopC